MELNELLAEIDRLKKELDGLLPMKKEQQERLDKKFRLEWNYNSNHIEGNTLTYGETVTLLLLNQETGDHDPRDYDEMRAHDLAIRLIYEQALDKERPLTEAFIKQLNKIILVKPFWKDAITPDGQRTKRLIDIGVYKSYPNSVRLSNGEMFHYPSPEETPPLVEELIRFYKTNENDSGLHVVALASLLHYRFVRIHPFDDGNGRTARLLMNYALIRHGFPPVIIKSENKRDYLFALSLADEGDETAFIKYIAKELLWSMHLSVKAAKGESIEDADDIDKEIAIFKRNLLSDVEAVYVTPALSRLINDFIADSLLPLLERLTKTLMQFNDLFYAHSYAVYHSEVQKETTFPESFYTSVYTALNASPVKDIRIGFLFTGLKKASKKSINVNVNLNIAITSEHYSILFSGDDNLPGIKKALSQKITAEEERDLIRAASHQVITSIQHATEKMK